MRTKGSRLLIDEKPLQVVPSLAMAVGLNRAIFLQQLHYWLQETGHERDGRLWIYNTFQEWHEQFPFWSPEAIRKIASQLQNKRIVITTSRYNERKGDRTLWYTIDYDILNSLLDPADKSTERPDQPDKSTEQPDKSTELEPDKSTQRYQRVPERNNRDSGLQPGDGPATPMEKEDKPMPLGQFFNKELAERIMAKRESGITIHTPTDREKKDFAAQFKQLDKDGYDMQTLLMALEYQIAKAAGEIEGEPSAWCGFRTALDRVEEGWDSNVTSVTSKMVVGAGSSAYRDTTPRELPTLNPEEQAELDARVAEQMRRSAEISTELGRERRR